MLFFLQPSFGGRAKSIHFLFLRLRFHFLVALIIVNFKSMVSWEKGADTMKRSTKVKIGVGVVVAASTATAVIASGKLIEKARHVSNRYKVKRFVNDKFDGNEPLLSIVDKLSDEDLDNIMSILDKIKSGKKRVSVYGESIKDTTEDLKGKLMDFVDKMM